MAPSDLEERRRAIAAALREAMADPQAAADDDTLEERVPVPPVEPAGEMSEIAANVLFGPR